MIVSSVFSEKNMPPRRWSLSSEVQNTFRVDDRSLMERKESCMINTILFDLDGTLLRMDQDAYTQKYFSILGKAMASFHEPEQMIRTVWAGTKAMIQNDGRRTNEEVFWDAYESIFGKTPAVEKESLERFYAEDFGTLREFVDPNPEVPPLIDALKKAGLQMIVATNPLFPIEPQYTRVGWAGLDPADFLCVTSYEYFHHSKPDIGYYREIVETYDLDPEKCLMVGNDLEEDMIAMDLGMKGFLLTDCLINRSGGDIAHLPHGGYADLRQYLTVLGIPGME